MKKSELREIIREEIKNLGVNGKNSLTEANSKFAKKQYIEIAKILKNSKSVDEVRNKLADMFEEDNPRFDKDKFIQAAGG